MDREEVVHGTVRGDDDGASTNRAPRGFDTHRSSILDCGDMGPVKISPLAFFSAAARPAT
jgi:hypothetical protein